MNESRWEKNAERMPQSLGATNTDRDNDEHFR